MRRRTGSASRALNALLPRADCSNWVQAQPATGRWRATKEVKKRQRPSRIGTAFFDGILTDCLRLFSPNASDKGGAKFKQKINCQENQKGNRKLPHVAPKIGQGVGDPDMAKEQHNRQDDRRLQRVPQALFPNFHFCPPFPKRPLFKPNPID